ncbi:MAG: hypothetical protein AABX52_02485 [Nanoarchaeota archaeon]
MRPELIKETAISLCEAKSLLDQIKDRDSELNYRSAKTAEYLDQFSYLLAKKAKECFKQIEELNIPRMRETHINKLIDIQPKTVEDVKLVLSAYTLTLKEEHLKKIVSILEEYYPKQESKKIE